MRNVLKKKLKNKEVSESLHASLRHSEAVQSGIQNLARNRKTKPKLYIKLNNIQIIEDHDVAHSLSDKTYQINNKLTFLRFLQVGRTFQ